MPKEGPDINFRAIPDESRIPLNQKDKVMSEIAKLESTLKQLFPIPCQYGKCEVGQYSGLTIVDRLIDTEETRIGDAPEGEAKNQLTREANLAIQKDCPVVLVGIYGTPRNLDHLELNSAQLADLSAIMMVQAALDRVHSAHPRGAKYRAIDENLTALWLDIAQHPAGEKGKEDFKKVYKKYFEDRQRLLKVLEKGGLIKKGNTKIELLSETDLYESASQRREALTVSAEEDFLTKCESIRPEILNYLNCSGQIIIKFYGDDDHNWISSEDNPQLWEQCQKEIMELKEYKALKETGWSGLIPPEMRKYYLEKFRTIIGKAELKANDPVLLFHVATYLASTLAKHKGGTLTEGIASGSPIIRVPLVRPVDGRPSTHQALIPQRTIPNPKNGMRKKLSSSNRAAWLSVAVQGDSKLRLVDTSKFMETPEDLIVPVQIYLAGPNNGTGSYLVDTAILLDKS